MRRWAAALLVLALSPTAWAGDGRRAAQGDELAALATIPGERVTLLVPLSEKARPEMSRLASELSRAAIEMSARLPGVPAVKPLTVVVEPDYVALGRHTGEIGEAGAGPRAEPHALCGSPGLGG